MITKFEYVTPKLSARELEMLTESILAHGVLDPIKVWGDITLTFHVFITRMYSRCKFI